MTITLPDDLIGVVGNFSIEIRKDREWFILTLSDRLGEFCDGHGKSTDEAFQHLARNAKEWLRELNGVST